MVDYDQIIVSMEWSAGSARKNDHLVRSLLRILVIFENYNSVRKVANLLQSEGLQKVTWVTLPIDRQRTRRQIWACKALE